jgi:hypothetical protein
VDCSTYVNRAVDPALYEDYFCDSNLAILAGCQWSCNACEGEANYFKWVEATNATAAAAADPPPPPTAREVCEGVIEPKRPTSATRAQPVDPWQLNADYPRLGSAYEAVGNGTSCSVGGDSNNNNELVLSFDATLAQCFARCDTFPGCRGVGYQPAARVCTAFTAKGAMAAVGAGGGPGTAGWSWCYNSRHPRTANCPPTRPGFEFKGRANQLLREVSEVGTAGVCSAQCTATAACTFFVHTASLSSCTLWAGAVQSTNANGVYESGLRCQGLVGCNGWKQSATASFSAAAADPALDQRCDAQIVPTVSDVNKFSLQKYRAQKYRLAAVGEVPPPLPSLTGTAGWCECSNGQCTVWRGLSGVAAWLFCCSVVLLFCAVLLLLFRGSVVVTHPAKSAVG